MSNTEDSAISTTRGVPAPQSVQERSDDSLIFSPSPDQWRNFYDQISRSLESAGVSEDSYFLNYGYVSIDSADEACISVVEVGVNITSVRLVYELLGSTSLTDCVVLDVGCGRGGTAALLADLGPSRVVGIDLSPEAIAFCRKNYSNDAMHFKVGNAMKIGIPDSSCDVVVNVESSHCYEDRSVFLSEVDRVLCDSGTFLYTDLLTSNEWSQVRDVLNSLCFRIDQDRDITANVLASRDAVHNKWSEVFGEPTSEMTSFLTDFLAVPGSSTYRRLAAKELEYRIIRASKPI